MGCRRLGGRHADVILRKVPKSRATQARSPRLRRLQRKLGSVVATIKSADEYQVEVFRALADPIRLDIVRRMAGADEVACTDLERSLPVTKSTISYHIKVLSNAGLVQVRKEGRNYFYQPRHDVIAEHAPALGAFFDSLKEGAEQGS